MYDFLYFFFWLSFPTLAYIYDSFVSSLLALFFIWFLLNIFPRFFGLEPMSGKDSLFLLESRSNKLLVTSISTFSSKLTLEQYKSCAQKALSADPRTKKYIVKIIGRYYWKVDKSFDLKNHYIINRTQINKDYLENYVNNSLTNELNPNHPPYQIHFFENYEKEGAAVVFRFHHSFADGLAVVSMMTWCADEGSCKLFYSPSEPGLGKKIIFYTLAVLTCLFYTTKIFLQRGDKNALHGQKLSGNKAVSWSNQINLTPLLQISKSKKITLNDLLTAIVLESLQKYAGEDLGRITATIPFSLRGQPKDGSFLKLENDLTIFPISFPKVDEKLVDNVAKLFHNMKESLQPFVVYLAMRFSVDYLPEFLVKSIIFYVVNKATLLYSNVGGPKGPIFYNGHKFDSIIGMSPNMARCGISVTSFSYVDHLIVTCYADKAVMENPKDFIKVVEDTIQRYVKEKKLE